MFPVGSRDVLCLFTFYDVYEVGFNIFYKLFGLLRGFLFVLLDVHGDWPFARLPSCVRSRLRCIE